MLKSIKVLRTELGIELTIEDNEKTEYSVKAWSLMDLQPCISKLNIEKSVRKLNNRLGRKITITFKKINKDKLVYYNLLKLEK